MTVRIEKVKYEVDKYIAEGRVNSVCDGVLLKSDCRYIIFYDSVMTNVLNTIVQSLSQAL